jgi:hypothetical protein
MRKWMMGFVASALLLSVADEAQAVAVQGTRPSVAA